MKQHIVAQNLEDGMAIPAGGLILWGVATAPEGWSFDTELDGLFVLGGTATDLTIRGADTHTHTIPSTVSNGGAHNNHAVSVAQSGYPSSSKATPAGDNRDVTGTSHTHTGSATSQSEGGGHAHTWPASGAANNLPAYVGLRWIKGGEVVPVGGIVMAGAGFVVPDGWAVCDGLNGTPDMRDKFVRAVATNGGTNDDHTHTTGASSSSGAHVHTVSIASAIGYASTSGVNYTGSAASNQHQHLANNIASASAGAHTHTMGAMGGAETVPPYFTVWFVRRMV